VTEPTKQCATCAHFKPLAAYTRSARSPDGKHRECRLCSRDRTNRSRRTRGMGDLDGLGWHDYGPSLADVRRAEAEDEERIRDAWERMREHREAAQE
jgi:hypothetical protein